VSNSLKEIALARFDEEIKKFKLEKSGIEENLGVSLIC